MNDNSDPVSAESETAPVEVRTYFVRKRNALVARADFSGLFVDYYLHQGQLGMHHAPFHDGMFKEALAALTLHCASRPWNETMAWTLHFQRPLLNLFVTGDNTRGTVIGQIFTDEVKDLGRNAFFADVVKEGRPLRRSSVEFTTAEVFRAVETYYARSEQRPARYFVHGADDFVMVSAQPDCDLEWIELLTDGGIRALDRNEQLRLLESRRYRWFCGCSHQRMMEALEPVMKSDPSGLFGGEASLRMRCPRCGRRHLITRESMEAFLAE
jgi:redox-regulated HSP33 family molecular chaperone